MIDARHRAGLVEILGDKGVASDAAGMAAYATGARYDEGHAALVLRPQTTEEVSACIAYCVRENLPRVPQSGNTGLVSGSTPDDSGAQIVLSLDRMTVHFDLDADNRSLRLDAGFRLSDVNARLEQAGLFFPIDLGADPRIGGMLATNTGGSRFLKYGDVRRNTLGMKIVLADEAGTVIDLMAGLRKNNTSVDWKQLFIGTSGAFGIITECVLNLEPLPRQVSTAYLVPRSGTDVMPLLRAIEERLGSYLSAFEGMSKNAMSAAFAHVPSLRNPFQSGEVPDYVIMAELSRSWQPRPGEQALDAVLEAVLTRHLGKCGCTACRCLGRAGARDVGAAACPFGRREACGQADCFRPVVSPRGRSGILRLDESRTAPTIRPCRDFRLRPSATRASISIWWSTRRWPARSMPLSRLSCATGSIRLPWRNSAAVSAPSKASAAKTRPITTYIHRRRTRIWPLA